MWTTLRLGLTIRRFAWIGCLAALAVTTGFTQQSSSRRSPNFDIRALRARMSTGSAAAPSIAREAQVSSAAERLATSTGLDGSTLRYSLNSRGHLKLLSSTSKALTGPSPQTPALIALAWLAENRDLLGYNEQDVATMAVTEHPSPVGLDFVSLEQVLEGLPVFGSVVRIGVDADGRIVQVQGGAGAPATQVLPYDDQGPLAAIGSAYRSLGLEPEHPCELLSSGDSVWDFYSNPESPNSASISSRLIAFPVDGGTARAAYRISAITSVGSYDMIVSADTGQLLYRVDLRSHLGSANVWIQSPSHGDREVAGFGENWLSPGARTSKGNNVDAFLDTNGDGLPDRARVEGLVGGRAFDTDQDFDYPAGDGFGDSAEFAASAVAHAFYHANVAHDFFYDLGFQEAEGNFQEDNFGIGGKGGDPVALEVHSSEAAGSAFFSTLPDGGPGVLTIGAREFDDGSFRDLSLSGQVITHEYAHGVTSRIVGGKSETTCLIFGAQGEALAEGWSDYFAASQFDDPVVGSYTASDSVSGIRRFALDKAPWRYSDLGNETLEPHNDGEIFSGALWDMRTALGAETTDALVHAALYLTPCEPSFIDARDALLTADQSLNAGTNQEAIWIAFAARGMGFGAVGADPPLGPVWTRFDSTTDLPVEFGGANRSPVVTSEPAAFAIVGETESYKVFATDPEGDDWTVEMLSAPASAEFDPDLRRVSWRPSFTEGRFVFAVTDSNGNKTMHGFVWLTFSVLNMQNSLRIDGPPQSIGVAGFLVEDPIDLLQITTRGGSGDPDLTVWPPLFGLIDSFSVGTDETVSIQDPDLGVWFVVVTGAEAYNGARLRVRSVQPANIELNDPADGLFDADTGERVFKLSVPEGTASLHAQLSGGNGDADLFVAEGYIPICSATTNWFCDFDESSESLGSYEAVQVDAPTAGDWFITVMAFEAYEDLTLTVSTSASPATISAATEGAAFEPIVAPGGISTLFGSGFTEPGVQAVATSLPLETELVGIQVFVNGVPAPLYFVSETQINFQLPFEAALESVDIVVIRDGQVSLSFEATVEQDVPRLFSFVLEEQVEPIVTHVDGSIVTPSNGADSGETLIGYLTGVGDLVSPPDTGAPAGANPLSTTTVTPTVVVNGVEVTADFSGLAPGLVGLVQVNFRMPEGLPAGTRVTIEIRYGGAATQAMTIAIK